MKNWLIILLLMPMVLLSGRGSAVDGIVKCAESFKVSGIEFSNYSLQCTVDLKEHCTSKEDMERIVQNIFDYFSISSNTETYTYDKKSNTLSASASYNGGCINIITAAGNMNTEENYNSTVCIDITQYEGLQNINDIGKEILKSIGNIGSNPCLKLCIKGNICGRMSQDSEKKAIDKILNGLDAKKVDTVRDGKLTSICGYSDYIPDFINYSNNRVNINVASRYSPYDDKTYFWIGTPIINAEY